MLTTIAEYYDKNWEERVAYGTEWYVCAVLRSNASQIVRATILDLSTRKMERLNSQSVEEAEEALREMMNESLLVTHVQ